MMGVVFGQECLLSRETYGLAYQGSLRVFVECSLYVALRLASRKALTSMHLRATIKGS